MKPERIETNALLNALFEAIINPPQSTTKQACGDCARALQAVGTEVANTLVELGIDAKDISIRGTLAMWAGHAAAAYDGRIPIVRLGPPV